MPDRRDALTELERQVLAFENRRWPGTGAKEQGIADQLGLTSTQYYQVLNAAIDKPAALQEAPGLVTRLRRVRDARRKERFS